MHNTKGHGFINLCMNVNDLGLSRTLVDFKNIIQPFLKLLGDFEIGLLCSKGIQND